MTRSLFPKRMHARTSAVTVCLVLLVLVGCGVDSEPSPPPAPRQQATGLIPVDEQLYINLPVAIVEVVDPDLPPVVDLSPSFPPPGDQNPQPSCVAWAVGYALKTYQETVERSWSPTTADHQFSPAFIYNQIKPCADCSCGLSIADALGFLTETGCCTLDLMPYDAHACDAQPDAATTTQAARFRIDSWKRVDFSNSENLKSQLANGYPVVLGIEAHDQFFNLTSADPVYDDNSGPLRAFHAIVITGYDDQTGWFKLINSWSTAWGDGGYFYIPYDFLGIVAIRAYVAEDLIQPALVNMRREGKCPRCGAE